MPTRRHLTILIVVLLCGELVFGCESVFNRVVRLEGSLPEEGGKRGKPYSLEIHTDDTFCLKVLGEELKEVQLAGPVTHEEASWGGAFWTSHKWVLGEVKDSKSTTVGTVEYGITTGVQWSHDVNITGTKRSLIMKGSEVRYEYLPWVVLGLFAVLGLFIVPINDTGRSLLLYNIKRRTHPIYLAVILLKMLFIAVCYLVLVVRLWVSFENTWLLLLVVPITSLAFIPSLFHLIYFLVTAQKAIRDLTWFSTLSHNVQIIAVIVMLSIFTVISVVILLVPKGLWFYFVLSSVVGFQYIHSIRIRKYAFGRILIYDFLVTCVLFVFSLWVPLANFQPLSFKGALLFWNYCIFLFAIGMLLMKKMIRIELVEEVQLEEFTVMDHPERLEFDFTKESDRRVEVPGNASVGDIDSDR